MGLPGILDPAGYRGGDAVEKENRCFECQRMAGPDDEGEMVRLERCVICFRWFCEEHFAVQSGRKFCSRRCGEYFFFSDSED